MDILIHAEKFTLEDRKRDLILEKVGKLQQYMQRALRARVTLRMDSAHASEKQFVAKLLMEVPGQDMAAEQKASEPLEAVDLLVEKMERQLRKRKTERISKRTKGVDKEAIAFS
ncbi:MAG: ribosome-associated translation inhibitor RaiA [Verrucomicrobia bacterium]|nr:ribosome-associated translation inhibitor RaiA [Verrucomicrobiota bacterium]